MDEESNKGHKDNCCCNCKHLRTLYKHPQNKEIGKGSIMEPFGYACLNPEITEGTGAIFFDTKHGMCESHLAY